VPVAANGVVYTFGAEGQLHAVDLASGKKIWSVDTARQFGVAKGFFGAAGSHSTGGQIIHTGIYVGDGWFIHSSGEGVALASLTGWYRTEFAWGRRPLREAGLS